MKSAASDSSNNEKTNTNMFDLILNILINSS